MAIYPVSCKCVHYFAAQCSDVGGGNYFLLAAVGKVHVGVQVYLGGFTSIKAENSMTSRGKLVCDCVIQGNPTC